jgi:hypothetical protein
MLKLQTAFLAGRAIPYDHVRGHEADHFPLAVAKLFGVLDSPVLGF